MEVNWNVSVVLAAVKIFHFKKFKNFFFFPSNIFSQAALDNSQTAVHSVLLNNNATIEINSIIFFVFLHLRE